MSSWRSFAWEYGITPALPMVAQPVPQPFLLAARVLEGPMTGWVVTNQRYTSADSTNLWRLNLATETYQNVAHPIPPGSRFPYGFVVAPDEH